MMVIKGIIIIVKYKKVQKYIVSTGHHYLPEILSGDILGATTNADAANDDIEA